MRRLFVIWNRSYRTQMVIAEDAQEALQISLDSGHIKRITGYRRFADCTDDQDFMTADKLRTALEMGINGVVEKSESDDWLLDGKLVE